MFRRKRALVGVLFLAALLGGGGVLLYRLTRPAVGDVATVRRGTIEASITTLGRVQPKRQLSLATRANGKVQRVLVQEGDVVPAGALLVELEGQELAGAVEQAERVVRLRQMQLDAALRAPDSAALDLARARLRVATAARLKAQKDYDKIADKLDAESSDEALDLETAKLEYELAQAEFDRTVKGATDLQREQARTELAEAQLALRQARERVEQTHLIAPFTGTVMSILPQVGENVYAYNALVRLADLTRLEIRAEIDELDIPSVAVGQRVQIRLDAFPGRTLQGRVVRVMPGVSEARGTTTYGALIEYDGEGLPIRPGMGANLTITTRIVEGALLVPRRAVRPVGRQHVVRVAEARRTTDVLVTVGLSNESEIEVLTGLSEGQKVLLN